MKFLNESGFLKLLNLLKTNFDTKVDKITDKGLSSNDYTNAEKEKLAGIEAGANKYILPVAGESLGGIRSGTDITIDSTGNVSVNDDSHNHIISNIDGLQDVLDNKSNNGHTHNYAASDSAGGPANSVKDGAVSRSKLAWDALFSPILAVEADTLIGAEHCGMTLLAGTEAALSIAYDETIPVGSEFAVLNSGEAAVTFSVGANTVFLLCDGSTPVNVTVTPFGMAAAKLISRDTVEQLDRWYITGNVEVVE